LIFPLFFGEGGNRILLHAVYCQDTTYSILRSILHYPCRYSINDGDRGDEDAISYYANNDRRSLIGRVNDSFVSNGDSENGSGSDGGGSIFETDSDSDDSGSASDNGEHNARDGGSGGAGDGDDRVRFSGGLSCSKKLCCCVLCILAILVTVASMILVLRFTIGNFYSSGEHYGPTETRIIPFSKFLCQNMKVKTTYDGSQEYNVSFHLLSSHPGFFKSENFSISETLSAKSEHHYLLYMNSGSEVAVSACFIDSAAVTTLTGFYMATMAHTLPEMTLNQW